MCWPERCLDKQVMLNGLNKLVILCDFSNCFLRFMLWQKMDLSAIVE